MIEHQPIINAVKVCKAFSGVSVLNDIDFQVYPGEVHALIGENGAGKSTLVKIISGVFPPTSGELRFEEKPLRLSSPHDARAVGIALINQEPSSFPDLNVVENVFLGHTRDGHRMTINWKEKIAMTDELLLSLGVKMRATDPVKNMSVADQQMLEIVNALSQNAKLIIMDEPTAALSQHEVQNLFRIVKKLKEDGKAIVFIGHRLDEILEIADRITVLRDGSKIGEIEKKDASEETLVQMMIGRTFSGLIKKEHVEIGKELLRVEGLSYPGKYTNVSISVRRGEIVGMAGLVGAGRSEMATGIYGTLPAYSGKIFIEDQEVSIRSPQDAKKHRIAMVSEDRAKTGLLLPASISNNMVLSVLKEISRYSVLHEKKEAELAEKFAEDLNVKMRNRRQPVKDLSGGNQQKVVIAKSLLSNPDILILDEPTRGIDVGAKAEVYKLIGELAKQGKAILMISSEMQEILQLSDRVYVMCEGRVTAELTRDELDSARIMVAASTAKGKQEGEGCA